MGFGSLGFWGFGFWVQDLGLRIWDFGFRFLCRAQGLGFRIQSMGSVQVYQTFQDLGLVSLVLEAVGMNTLNLEGLGFRP